MAKKKNNSTLFIILGGILLLSLFFTGQEQKTTGDIIVLSQDVGVIGDSHIRVDLELQNTGAEIQTALIEAQVYDSQRKQSKKGWVSDPYTCNDDCPYNVARVVNLLPGSTEDFEIRIPINLWEVMPNGEYQLKMVSVNQCCIYNGIPQECHAVEPYGWGEWLTEPGQNLVITGGAMPVGDLCPAVEGESDCVASGFYCCPQGSTCSNQNEGFSGCGNGTCCLSEQHCSDGGNGNGGGGFDFDFKKYLLPIAIFFMVIIGFKLMNKN